LETSAIAAFWGVALLLVIAPGADWAYTLSAVLRGNAVRSAVGGLITGYALMTVVVAAGVGALVAGSGEVLASISLIGGAYLVWLGISTVRDPAAPTAPKHNATRTERGTFLEGIGVRGLNPKGLLIFVAMLPQFTTPRSPWPVAVQMGVLGVTFILTCAVFYSVLGSFARKLLQARPAAARAMSRVAGIGMVVIGSLLVIERLLA
jgi:threonine/homoserine/homoserine lactone efflux protein